VFVVSCVLDMHPYYTYQILERVQVFGELAFDASAHHERLDGRGYFRNLLASSPCKPASCARPTISTRSRPTAPTAASCPPSR